MRPIETTYRGCRFRSRLEARWAVFFNTLELEWWYEPEGFALQFDYEEFAADWRYALNMTEDELLQEGVPQTFQHLDGKEYTYLPDFYLPELNVWVEIKGPNPTREEIEKAFLLNHMVTKVAWAKLNEAKPGAESRSAFDDLGKRGVYIIYGDIPWPFPQKGNIFGYGGTNDSGSSFLDRLARAQSVPGESEIPALAEFRSSRRSLLMGYRSLLMGQLNLCWQECPLCLKIGVGELGAPYCRSCHTQIALHIWNHLARYRVSEAGNQVISDQLKGDAELWEEIRPGLFAPNSGNVKTMELTKSLMNPEFFTSGHKTPKLQRAYNAARSARFEHGQAP